MTHDALTRASMELRPNWKIIDFDSGDAPDHRGRYLKEVQRWSDEQLEFTHDYIQWLFPLPERSGFNLHAPTLDDLTIREFRSRPALQASLLASFRRLLVFYGFEVIDEPKTRVREGPQFRARASNWLTAGNHNHLRITRILRSMCLLGQDADATAFFDCLSSIYADEQGKPEPAISIETFEHWKTAVNR